MDAKFLMSVRRAFHTEDFAEAARKGDLKDPYYRGFVFSPVTPDGNGWGYEGRRALEDHA
jgi:hypothetical protein